MRARGKRPETRTAHVGGSDRSLTCGATASKLAGVGGQTRIDLLGRFTVSVGGIPIPDGSWRLRKSRSVIKVLALAPGRTLHPERMQGLLWPERDPASASN